MYVEITGYKGATKSHFTHYSCMVIILFHLGLRRSAFSTISYRLELNASNQDIKICAFIILKGLVVR